MRNTTISCLKAFKKCIMLVMIAVTAIFQLEAQTYSFTTCGATGTNGPTQTQINLAYASSSITGVVSNNGIQEWTVPATGLYSIKVAGAKGGGNGGGNGAVLSGEFILTQGHVIQIVVGQRGTGGFGQLGSVNSGGGGGGSFVVNKTTNTILLIAGGGGGGNGDYGSVYPNTAGNPASTGTAGNSTYQTGGGTGGNGGKNGVTDDPAAGGGGYLTNGENSPGTTFAGGGQAFVNGARGGAGRTGTYFGGNGGFGGGGGGTSNILVRGGGGGGYSGGQGGTYQIVQTTVYTSSSDRGHGAGGGSINNGTNPLIYTTNAAAGYVTVTTLSTPAGALNFVKNTNLSGNYITVPHSASLNLGAEFTIEAWVNYTGTNSTIIDKGDYNYLMQLNCSNPGFAPNRIDFYSRNNGQWAHSTGTVPEGVWTHVAITLKNGTLTFYINGVASGSAPMVYSQDTGPVNIGRQSPTSCACNSFNGSMDELRIWNRALTSCEINTNKSCELSGAQTALAAYYKFNQGSVNTNNSGVNTLTDASGNNNTGTLNGFALTGTTSNWVAGQVSGTCAVYTVPTAAITGTLSACPGATSQLNNSITGGTWSSSNNSVATINGSGLVTAVAAGTTTITYTNSCGGVSTATFTVNALPAASISTSGSTTICTGGSVTLSAIQSLPGNSLSFNGTNNAVRIPDVNYAGVNSFTIEAWVKPNNITTNPYYEIARQQGSPNWIFSFQDYGTILSFGLNTTTGYTELDAPITAASFTDGNWHHVAATYDGTNCRVYKDGVLIGTNSKTGNILFASAGTTTYIGAYSGGEYFNGLIDEVRFWNTTRTQAQLDANKLVSLPGNTTGLTAYYKFDEGTGTTTNDASGNNNHGTLINGTSWSAQTPISSGTGGTYLWSNGATTPSITVSTAGAYTVKVTNASGCSQTSIPTNVLVNTVPVASISAGGPTTFCAGGSVTLTASGGAGYLWSNGANTNSINVTAGGTYSVTATSADGCVSAPASITLTQLPAPTVNPITNREVCHNALPVTAIAFTGNISGTVYNWTNNNPSIGLAASGTGDIASFLGQNTGTVPVYATVTVTPSYTDGTNTCTGTPMSFVIRVNPIPVIDPIANITVCNGTVTQPFTLSSAVAGSVFRWTQPGNIPNVNVGLPNGDGANVPSFTATNTGTTPITATFYAVSYYSGETMGCGTSRQFDVTVNPTPAANITAGGPTTFCTGGSVTLTASTGASYLWSTGAQTQSITVNQSGNYSVVVTSAAGCSNTSSPTVVTVNALPAVPVISASGSTTVCVGNAVTLSAGAAGAGNAIDFDGSNDNIVIPNNAAFNFTSQYTAEAWINVRSYQYGTIIAKFEDDNNNRGWMVNMGETGDATKIHVVHSRLGSWTNPIQWNSGFQPALNTWYHIAVVFDANLSSNQIKLYVNGALTAQTSWPYTITPNAANMYIGGYDGPGNGVNAGANARFFNGRIDEVRVWNVARTAPQINANYNQIISTPTTGLVAAYSFNETSGNAILDVTGVNNGTMVNNPTRISNGPSIIGGGASNTYLWSTGATSSSISVTQPGNYSVTVTNENGCAATSAPVAVSNYAMPTITCPGNITVASPANQCGANVTYPNATVTAGPANPTVTYSHASGSFFPVGTTTVTATVTDACGKTASCTFTVTVQDVTPPVLACSNQSSSTPINFMRGTSVGGTAAIVAWTGINGASQYSGPSLGSSCSESWRPFGTLCDETPNTNSLTTSTKSNPNSGITFNTGGANSTGVFVVDLGATQTFNLAQVYQMFSDGKTTHVRGFYHPSASATAPSITDAGWIEMFPETLVGPGAISGNNVTQPTEVSFNTTSARYVRFYVRNDGRYGSSTWIETRSIKLFNTAPAVNNVVVTAADGQCNAVATYNVQAIDNCSGTVVTYSIPSGSSFPIGTTPVQVTATDAAGNTTTCSFSVIVNAPEINITGNGNSIATGTTATSAANNTNFGGTLPNTPVSKTFAIQNTGTASLTISSIALSGTDASAFSVSGITLPATIAANAAANFNVVFNSNAPGIKNATVTLNNNDCNEGTYQFAVSAEITCTNPVFINLNPQVQSTTTASTCNAVVNYPLAVTGIPAPGLSYTFSGATNGSGSGTGTGRTFNKGTTHVTVTAVNPCSTVVYEFDVIVSDVTAPTAVAQNLTINLSATGTASITAAQINNGSSDNCGIASIAVDKTSFDCSNVGANTVTLTVTDVNGNSSTATAVVTVVDNILPIATSQNITVNLNANGTASITAAQVNNGSSDNCGIASIAVDKTSFDCSNVGVNTVTLTVTDVNGNSSTATAVVTVVDNILPIATSQNITVQLGANGTASITAAQVNNGSSDNCGIASIAVDKTSFDCSNVGVNTVTLTVTDVNGNSSTATAVVTVVDNILPIATSQNITVQLGANGAATITAAQINNGSSDNCGIASIAVDKTSFDCSNVGANTVTLTVTDVNGNSSTATATVTVVDNILPIATSQNITVQLGANGAATITAAQINNGSSDNCGIASIAVDKTSFDCSNVGANTVTLTVTDVNGNSSTATAVVTVVDNVNPTITAPANIAQGTDAGVCGATVNLGTPVTADNCSIATVTNNAPAQFPVGTTVVTWTVMDVNGNSSTATQTVVITDTEKPGITAPAMVSVVNTAGTCSATVNLGTPVTSDNCGVATVTNNAPALFPVGTTIVTWTVTDIHGNVTDTATQMVVVIDNDLPTISVNNISVNNDAGKCGAGVSIPMPVTGDNCGVASVMGVRSDNKLLTEDYLVGTTTITWTVRDVNGNMKTISQTIKVSDNEKPVIACATNQVFCANTGGNSQYTIAALNQSDNCGIAGTTYVITGATNRTGTGTNASGSFAIGTSTVTFTVTDIHGNVSSCSFTVRINPLPVASITAATANALCNQFTLTANSSLSGPYSYQWLYNNTTKATTQQLSLGLSDGDGVYSVYTTDANGCRSELAATYNYQKQNLVSSYTILGMKEVKLGQYDRVETGSVGVMSSRGEAEFDKYSSVTGAGSFVKAPRIDTDRGVTINSKIYGVASVTLPTMQYNLSNTRYLQDRTINSNVTATIAGNYDEVTLKKGSNVTLTGTVFGKIKLEEGASVRFTATTLDVEEIQIEKGPKSGGYSYIRFAPNTSIRVSKKVTIGSDVIVNPEAYQVTFYMADNRRDEEKFHVKGDDTRITANIILPDGKLKVTGGNYGDDRCDHRPHSSNSCRHRGHGHHDCDHRGHGDRDCRDDVFMTGLFIAEEVESEGKNVIWNSYNCAAPSAPVTAIAASKGQATVVEEVTSSKLQAASKTEEDLKVTVMPNPSTTYFTLKLESRNDAPVTLRVVDGAGRVVDSRAKIGSNSTIQIGHNYHAGNYFAELVQGNRRKTIQLIKVR